MSVCTARVTGRHRPGSKSEAECPVCGNHSSKGLARGGVASPASSTSSRGPVSEISVDYAEDYLRSMSPSERSGFLFEVIESAASRRAIKGRRGGIRLDPRDWADALVSAREAASVVVPEQRREALRQTARQLVGDDPIRSDGIIKRPAVAHLIDADLGNDARDAGARDAAAELIYDSLMAFEAQGSLSKKDFDRLSHPWAWATDRKATMRMDLSPYVVREGYSILMV